MTTAYHAKYFAHELTKRCPSDSLQKLAASLADAQVDLNPHQIDAALFAFRSPLSKGAILADEVGLGKTIEAGILLSQKWAEKKQKLLIIVPAALRKQWNQELADKFFLPSVILENRSFNQIIKQGNLNPFNQSAIVICSYHFARAKDSYIKQVKWDLVIVDEAHRLRNVYKPTNRIANAIKAAIADAPKVLLTATPLQNSILELYGLVSIIDDFTFGDLKSFKAQFGLMRTEEDFVALRERIKPICQRTLRRQVLEYIKYTNRIPITQEFVPSEAEQRLYDLVSGYLQRETLYALPSSQRQLMTLILRKLLASSTYAISGTLDALANRLETAAASDTPAVETPEEVAADFEAIDEVEEEWDEDETPEKTAPSYTPEDKERMRAEIKSLREFKDLAMSIAKNSKGEVLLTALKKGFATAREMGAPEIITTHYRPWRNTYKNHRAPGDKIHFIELRPWTLDVGIRIQNVRLDLADLKAALAATPFDRQNVASKSGVFIENVLEFLARAFRCRLPLVSPPSYTLKELSDCLSAKLLKVLKVERETIERSPAGDKIVWTETQLEPLIAKIKNLAAVRNQVGAHYNQAEADWPDATVEELAKVAIELGEVLICSDGGDLPARDNSGSYRESRSKKVRLHPFQEPK
jgi:hypothetical protein